MQRIRQRRGTIHQQGGEKVYNPDSKQHIEFINPFSYESSPEARVQMELEARGVRFAYRYFAGGDSAVTIKKLIPDFAPEFTLPDYKVVIMIVGDFFGRLPGVLDKQGLEATLLHHDGWKAVVWSQYEIVNDGAAVLMHRDLPILDRPKLTGTEIPSPYGHPMTLETRRQYLRGLGLLKKLFGNQTEGAATHVSTERIRRHRFIGRDSNRYRPGRKERGKSYE